MKHLKIPIPEKKDWKRWFEILAYKLRGGFKCKGCGTKMPFKHLQLQTNVEGKRLILENHTPLICPDCTVDELNKHEDKVFKIDCKCDWCGQERKTMSYTNIKDPNIFITFGSQWWNGHYICQDCITELKFSKIKLESSKLYLDGNKTYFINELGLKVDPDECNFRRY